MNEERLMQVLLAPQISEKATLLGERNHQVVFRVVKDATKTEIKAAVALMFKVEVESVQVLNTHAKTKRFRGFLGKQKSWKKAFVRLKEGFEINFVEGGFDGAH